MGATRWSAKRETAGQFWTVPINKQVVVLLASIHELMHSVGFFHEQSRADRDNYVNVLWDNIDPNLRDQFDKYSLNMIDYLGTKYDYGSVMHYGKYAFSKNGKETLEPREAGKKIGQRTGFSATDLYKINRLYECPGTAAQPPPSDSDSLLVSVSNPSSSSAAAGSSSPGVDANSNTVLIGGGGSSSCEDQRKDCAYLKDRGHCESIFSSAFMLIHCGRTCNKCLGEATSQCSDSMPYCPNWAAQGLCEVFIFQPYMHANCRDSCQLC